MGSEIGNKGLLRKVADLLQILGQNQMPAELAHGPIQPVIDIGNSLPQNVPMPNAAIPAAQYSRGIKSLNCGATNVALLYLFSTASENPNCICSLDDINNGILIVPSEIPTELAPLIDIIIDQWDASLTMDAAGVAATVGKRFNFRVSINFGSDAGNRFTVYRDFNTQVVTANIVSYVWNKSGASSLDSQTVDVFKATTWNGWVPNSFNSNVPPNLANDNSNSLIAEVSFLDGTNFPANTVFKCQAIGRYRPYYLPRPWQIG